MSNIDKQTTLTAVLALTGTLGGALFGYKSAGIDADITEQSLSYERIRTLEKSNAEFQGKYAEAMASIALLEAKIQYGKDITPTEALLEFVDHFPLPAWLKRWDPETQTFPMEGINIHYAQFYGISVDAYRGTTDDKWHPKEMAAAFFENDMRVLVSRGSDQFTEVVRTSDGAVISLDFYKFWLGLPDGTEFVAGVQIER